MTNFQRKVIASYISPKCNANGCDKRAAVKLETGKNGQNSRIKVVDNSIFEVAWLCEEHFKLYEKNTDLEIIWLSHHSTEISTAKEDTFGLRSKFFVTPYSKNLKISKKFIWTDPKVARAGIVGDLNERELEKLI